MVNNDQKIKLWGITIVIVRSCQLDPNSYINRALDFAEGGIGPVRRQKLHFRAWRRMFWIIHLRKGYKKVIMDLGSQTKLC